jgi:hypothetical protein
VGASLVGAVSRHPSLAALAVHDDPVDLVPEPLGTGFLAGLKRRIRNWRASYDRGPAATVGDSLPTDRPVFPVVGHPAIDPDAVTTYPGWDEGDVDDVASLLEGRFDGDPVVEFGAGSLGTAEPSETAGFDRTKHDARVPAEEGDAVAASQRYQAAVCKRVTETLRRRDVPVLAAYAMRDTADAGMGVLCRDGTQKIGYGAVSQSFEPVQAVLTAPSAGESTDVVVLNDTRDRVTGQLSWHAGDGSSDAAASRESSAGAELAVDVGAMASETVDSVTIPTEADELTLALTLGDRTVENTYRL